MFKKLLFTFVIFFLAVFAFACGSEQQEEPEKDPTEDVSGEGEKEPEKDPTEDDGGEVEKDSNNFQESNVKYIHLSFDDVTTCFQNLSNNNYSNLFEEPFFGELKYLHDEYNAKFSLYTYNSVLNSVSDKYVDEFIKSNNWLKIGFHSNVNGLNLNNASYDAGVQYWNDFVNNIIRICGSTDSLDRMPRLEYFSGSHNALFGMRDANYGALGFLSADDNRLSYYFDNDIMNYLYENDYINDRNNDLTFLSTDIRCDWFYDFNTTNVYKCPVKDNIYDELIYRNNSRDYDASLNNLIIFTHEWLVYNGITINSKFDSITNVCKFSKEYNIIFDYPQNVLFEKTESDYLFDNIDFSSYINIADRRLKVINDIENLLLINSALESGGRLNKSVIGRATDEFNILSGVAGKTISLNLEIMNNRKIYLSILEIKKDGSFNQNGYRANKWLSEPVKLQDDTEYILIAFKNNDGLVDFTLSDLEMLPKCIVLN